MSEVEDHVHDCVVVGAGPAGSAAALQMARDGLDVVFLERGDRPGQKNVMSGVLVTHKLYDLVPDYRDRAPLQRCITGGYALHLLGENKVLSLPRMRNYCWSEHPRAPFTVFRSQFDAWFAQEAENAGAELFTATLVEDLLWEDGRVAGVRTRRGDLRARVVIGADGVNSTVAEKSGLRSPPSSAEVGLIVREVFDLPADVIEERFALRPDEGALSAFAGLVSGPTGNQAVYYTEIYTNRDSLSMTSEVQLDALALCGAPTYEVLEARKRHPYIARLIQGATLREYQAHLIPWGGVADLGCLYGDGVLLAGDAGKFTTADGVGSWTSMASGAAAARTVKYACEKGDFSKATLAVYRDFMDQEGLVATQQEARRVWQQRMHDFDLVAQYSDPLFRIAGRYLDRWGLEPEEQPYSLWGEAYHNLVKPLAPWYLCWFLGLVAWFDTRRWRRRQTARHGGGTNR